MKGKKHQPEQIIRKLREADAMLAAGVHPKVVPERLGHFHRRWTTAPCPNNGIAESAVLARQRIAVVPFLTKLHHRQGDGNLGQFWALLSVPRKSLTNLVNSMPASRVK
jgi:hypothetical protein